MNFIKKIFFLSLLINTSLYCAQPAQESPKYKSPKEECDVILKQINSPKGRKLLKKISKFISQVLKEIPKSKSDAIGSNLLNKINRFIKAHIYIVTLVDFYAGINEVDLIYDEDSIMRQEFYIGAEEVTQKALLTYIKAEMCKILYERKNQESKN